MALRAQGEPFTMSAKNTTLGLTAFLQPNPENGGFFVSRGRGTHPDRILKSYLSLIHI